MSRERRITPAITATIMTQIGTPLGFHTSASGIAVVTNYINHQSYIQP